MSKELTDVNIQVCRKCKYYWGENGGMGRNSKTNFSTSQVLCSYYVDTGKHRMDEHDKGFEEADWLNKCNKFEPYSRKYALQRTKNNFLRSMN